MTCNVLHRSSRLPTRSLSHSVTTTTKSINASILPTLVLSSLSSTSTTRTTIYPSGLKRVSRGYTRTYRRASLVSLGNLVSFRFLANDLGSPYTCSHFFHHSVSERQPHWTVRAVCGGFTYHTLHVFADGRMADSFDNGGRHWQTHRMYRGLYRRL